MRHTRWICAIGLLAIWTILVAVNAAGNVGKSTVRLQVSDCSSLQGLAIPASEIGLPTSGGGVKSAERVAETAEGNISGEFCKVIGIIKPVNSASPNIEFQVNLPSSWNRRALQMGGGGYNGTLVTGLTTQGLQAITRVVAGWYRDLSLVSVGADEVGLNQDRLEELQARAHPGKTLAYARAVMAAGRAQERLRYNVDARLAVGDMFRSIREALA